MIFRDRIIQSTMLAMFMALPVYADIYKWTDDNGKVHYSDKPVENSQQLELREKIPDTPAVNREQREERRNRLLQAFEEDRVEKDKQKKEQDKKKAILQRNCAVARDRLRRYQNVGRLYNLDKDGNRIYLSEEEKNRSVTELQMQIDKYCN